MYSIFRELPLLQALVLRRWFNSYMGEVLEIKTADRMLFLLNVRLNNQDRADRLIQLLQFLGPESRISLRVRGNFSNDPFLVAFESSPNVDFYNHSSFQEWKLDLLEQVTISDCEYFVLLQEDHLPTVSLDVFRRVLDDCAKHPVDFMPLSFFSQNQPLVNSLNRTKTSNYRSQNISFWDLDKNILKNINSDLRIYPINLIGYFSKDLLIKILCTERPFFKGYSIDSPFDFEQRYDQSWYLPIKWASPGFELLACIDDDHGIPGYSLSSRGIKEEARERQVNHHQKGFVFGELPSTLSSIKQIFIRILPSRLLVLPRNLKYTWESVRGFRKRRNIKRRLLGNF
jgi:hypothetical protein